MTLIIFLFSILTSINCSTATQYIVKYVEDDEIIFASPSPDAQREPVTAALAFFTDNQSGTLIPTLGLIGSLLLAATAIGVCCCRRQNQARARAAMLDSGYSIV